MKKSGCIVAAAIAGVLTLGAYSVSANTYTWTNSLIGKWSQTANWDPAPIFDSQADVVFNMPFTNSNISYLGANLTVRSVTFGSPLASLDNNTFDVRNFQTAAATARTLTLSADSGNARITVEDNTSGLRQVRIGNNGGGNTILASSVDVYQHDADMPFLFAGVVTGAGAINKYGVGLVGLSKLNTFAGGINIYEGIIDLSSSVAAGGTGTLTIGGPGSSTNATLQFSSTLTYANNIVVSSGSGTRTISITASTLSGAMTLNKDVTFDATIGTGGDITVSGVISGNGGVVKTSDGTLVLSGNNNYTGNTTVNGGTLVLNYATLATGSTVTVTNDAVLQLNFAGGETNSVAAFVLNGISQPPGVYSSSNSSPYLAGAGSLLVVPTLNYTNLGGGNLELSWNGGGVLQVQTNTLSSGLGTNWMDYPGGGSSPVNVTMDPANGSVFFRVKQ